MKGMKSMNMKSMKRIATDAPGPFTAEAQRAQRPGI